MKYYCGLSDICFEIDAENYDDAIEKAWAFIYDNLPSCFDTEISELTYLNEAEEE